MAIRPTKTAAPAPVPVPVPGQTPEQKDATVSGNPPEPPPGVADDFVKSHFPVVGLVASAGGLEAFKQFFTAMPAASGMAFVVVPHLDATHKSMMVELLARQTSMQVVEATDQAVIESNCVYVIPPNHGLSLSHYSLRLNSLPDPTRSQTAIDSFLRSLAEEHHERAIGIVFSGTGSHGTQGIREIKRCGGLAMAQTPESAEFDQMPQNAIETGLVDFVLAPDKMPQTLMQYVVQPYVHESADETTPSDSAIEQLRSILDLIRDQTKYDFRGYRSNMLMRRIERRMGLMQLDELSKYLSALQTQAGEVESLCKDFLIGVTAFFREAEAFAVLEKEVLPELVALRDHSTPLRVWVPSCATGEEAYSIAILIHEAYAKAGKPPNVQIFASDINQHSIDWARRGLYPAGIASDVSAQRLEQFFTASKGIHYQVNKLLRDSIVFSKHNMLSDAPFSKMDLISCRNVLIYLEADVQHKLVSLFHFALAEKGYLLLGAAETIGRASSLFEAVSKKWRVFRRVDLAKTTATSPPIALVNQRQRPQTLESRSPAPRKAYKELTESILSDYTPAAILINQRQEILYVSGNVVNYLEFPTGEISKDLLAMARSGLRSRLRSICHNAKSKQITVVDNEAIVQRDGNYIRCTITARPLTNTHGYEGLMLILLQDQPARGVSDTAAPTDGDATPAEPSAEQFAMDNPELIQLLEYELKSTREELQNTVEEMESANEELQSSNEELESSKEELQSLNEELNTVNCQLLEKVCELDRTNSEMNSLMASTEIATLFLDSQLRIKRFTEPTVSLFNLLPADEGRHLGDFASHLLDNNMLVECQHVLQNEEPLESEIFTDDKRCILRRILPFRTAGSKAEGVVVTFVDLTARHQTDSEQRERDAFFREIFHHAATGIAIGDLNGIFEKCNPAFCRLVGRSESELRSVDFLALVHPDDQDHNLEALGKLQRGEVSSFEIEHRYLHKDDSVVRVRKFVAFLPDGSGNPAHLMALVTDITEQSKALDSLSHSEERLRAILKTASDAIITINDQGIIDNVNHATESMFGYSIAELVGRNVSILMPQPFRSEHDSYIQRFLTTGESHIIGTGREVMCRRKDGSTFPADLAVSQIEHLGLFTGVLRDISSRKEMQNHILEIAVNEQRRIGLELHDGTQQELTGLSLFAGAIVETINNATPVPLAENLVSGSDVQPAWRFGRNDYEQLKSTATLLSKRLLETHQHVRALAHGILPVQIDTEGLRSALDELASSVNSNEKVSCHFSCLGDYTIPNNTIATHIYRIAQEAVTNALRHGGADRIGIVLVLKDDRIALEVNDNGSGFDNASREQGNGHPTGMGMRTMEYRANMIGGVVQVERSPEGGTLVRCTILNAGNRG